MSTRQGWSINGHHFTKTTTERGGTRHFIDGTPYRRDEWLGRITAAQYDEAANTPATFEEQGIAE